MKFLVGCVLCGTAGYMSTLPEPLPILALVLMGVGMFLVMLPDV